MIKRKMYMNRITFRQRQYQNILKVKDVKYRQKQF